ncbi:Transcription factor [Podospora bellae-mahoneyi]|uniref:Transcription factor n=1 Tax=Podospora bellae-mahoneyi TaxID=2093777 RepID=A0ABR0FZB0_9PEZI|nr:Transcription factor [Podospora bellae-mahoneyi]
MASSNHHHHNHPHNSYPNSAASQSQTPISPSGLNGGGGGGEDGDKPRLTKEQKKTNHIQSEQKRRLAIRQAYDDLCTQVPGLEGQARSEGVVLNGVVGYVRKLMLERQRMIAECEARGLEVPAGVREGLANMPVGFLDEGEGGRDASGSVSPGKGSQRGRE